MKTCPTCSRTYDDDTLSFCLNDGAPLVSGSYDPQATQRLPTPPKTDPNASTDVYSSATWSSPPKVPPQQPPYGAWAEPQKRISSGGGGCKLWAAIGGIAAVLLLVVGVGAAIILSRGGWFGGNDSQSQTYGKNKNDSRGSERATATPTPTPKPTPTPTPDVPAAEKLGLVGNWSGLQNGNASTLTIVSGQGNAFSGTKMTGVNQISFVGSIDPVTRRMTINETKVLKGIPYSNGQGWSLGSETGILSADGRKMSGTGKDQYNRTTPYTWSYTKK